MAVIYHTKNIIKERKKNTKKLISLFLILTIILSMFSINVSAFGGYAHWYMAVKKAESYGDTKTDEVKLAYASGCLLADIGNREWDIKGKESDKYEFISKLYEISRDLNNRSRAMAYGWRDHYTQDWKVSIKAEMNPPAATASDAGWVDEYLRDELKPIDFPIQNNEVGEIYVGYTLIKETYKAVYNKTIDNDDIDEQIIKMFNAFDTQIAFNVFGWNDEQRNNIITVLQKATDLCVGIKASVPQPIHLTTTAQYELNINKSFADYQISKSSTKETDLLDLIDETEWNELAQYIHIEKKYISEDEAILKIKRNEIGSYNMALNSLINEKMSVVS